MLTTLQSVWASSEIEGEAISVKDMPVAIIGQPDPNDTEHSKEYTNRIAGARSIYSAYIWALSHPFPLQGGVALASDFVCELHRRMFETSKPDVAGKLKTKRNFITRDGTVVVKPLAPLRTQEFLDAACERISRVFEIAEKDGNYSKLVGIAEFLVDFLAIHPFGDGNGRLARLLSTYLLERGGFHFARFYPLDIIILGERKAYYDALMNSQRNWATRDEDLTPWVSFYLGAVYKQYLMARDRIATTQRDGSHDL